MLVVFGIAPSETDTWRVTDALRRYELALKKAGVNGN